MNAIQLPKIAVLLAAYNGEKYIEQQIASILSQECVHVDIFISLDKSTDKTIDILKAIQKKHHD
ncbi:MULTISPECIES: glycosyltransferase [Comamonas]|uniref:glycosyltransferase n=1 Tax=Comamonas TaxID=283 RepID=UPI00237D5F2E|nr:glycosyltransferase [Comamonas aquatica]MDE1554882.1 glycosyltransferase [Comamonas aquatica]